MGLDEVGTARTLREHRKVTDALVAKHGGRLVKTTGDGVLLEFPSVVDAVECAVAWQAVMSERNEGVPEDRLMLFRIGINLGDILIEGDDILGDGVNVAARLEGIAEPGGICISSFAYDHVRGKVPVEFTDGSIQVSPFAAFVMPPMPGATIQPFSPNATAPLRACDWPGCPRAEARQLTRRASGHTLVPLVTLGHACSTLRKSADASSQSSQQMSRATAASWVLTRSARSEG
jgi:hypothetical protein